MPKQKVTDYVDGLDPKLKQVGKEAAAEINDKFEEEKALLSIREQIVTQR